MRILFEKVPITQANCFIVREFRLPIFDTPLHVHPEFELTYIIQGKGKRVVGDSVVHYSAGDLVLIGSNLPHCWYSDSIATEQEALSHSIVVQFVPSFLGTSFFQLPEMADVSRLLDSASQGLSINPAIRAEVAGRMSELLTRRGAGRVIGLLDILNLAADAADHQVLASSGFSSYTNPSDSERINNVFRYIFDNFQGDVNLTRAAAIASMNPPAFCYYFKKRTRRSFSEFVNEIRIGHACKLLMDTDKTVSEICYESGFKNLAYFNRRFHRSQRAAPTTYRMQVRNTALKRE